jgi:Family of unknown function (DUF6480)
MTAIPPDPDPAETPGLEPGGGVAPGSTPPDSAQTSGLSHQEPTPRHRFTPTLIASLVAITVFVLLFVATAVWLIVDM